MVSISDHKVCLLCGTRYSQSETTLYPSNNEAAGIAIAPNTILARSSYLGVADVVRSNHQTIATSSIAITIMRTLRRHCDRTGRIPRNSINEKTSSLGTPATESLRSKILPNDSVEPPEKTPAASRRRTNPTHIHPAKRTNGVIQPSPGGRTEKIHPTIVMALHPVTSVPEYASAISRSEIKKVTSVPAVRTMTTDPSPINQGSCSAK